MPRIYLGRLPKKFWGGPFSEKNHPLLLAGYPGAAFSERNLWASGEGGGFSLDVIWQIIAFVLLAIFLVKVLKKPMLAFLIKRERKKLKTPWTRPRKRDGGPETFGRVGEKARIDEPGRSRNSIKAYN